MSKNQQVAAHYQSGAVLGAIRDGIARLGKDLEDVGVDDLAPADEFHIGGREATEHLAEQLQLSTVDHVLDCGCGLGGTSRFLASRYGCRVQGVDLTSEFITVGQELNRWVGLEEQIELHRGDVSSLDFEDGIFTAAVMLHVGMNIADKEALAREVYRVLEPGGRFGIFDIVRIGEGELEFPVPWAAGPETSHVDPPLTYRRAFARAGFERLSENDRRAYALEFFARQKKAREQDPELPPMGLHLLMGSATGERMSNAVRNLEAGLIAPVEFIFKKPS